MKKLITLILIGLLFDVTGFAQFNQKYNNPFLKNRPKVNSPTKKGAKSYNIKDLKPSADEQRKTVRNGKWIGYLHDSQGKIIKREFEPEQKTRKKSLGFEIPGTGGKDWRAADRNKRRKAMLNAEKAPEYFYKDQWGPFPKRRESETYSAGLAGRQTDKEAVKRNRRRDLLEVKPLSTTPPKIKPFRLPSFKRPNLAGLSETLRKIEMDRKKNGDTNGDGYYSKAELNNANRNFLKLDRNKDGKLSAAELFGANNLN